MWEGRRINIRFLSIESASNSTGKKEVKAAFHSDAPGTKENKRCH